MFPHTDLNKANLKEYSKFFAKLGACKQLSTLNLTGVPADLGNELLDNISQEGMFARLRSLTFHSESKENMIGSIL